MSKIGKTLENFEITALLGHGGMGEAYRTKDLKLGRDVAIKVLPEEFAKDADRVARFQREAKLLASLNHPSIASIYGLEESGGTIKWGTGYVIPEFKARLPKPHFEQSDFAEGVAGYMKIEALRMTLSDVVRTTGDDITGDPRHHGYWFASAQIISWNWGIM
jgi:serine/threonine protein kinase